MSNSTALNPVFHEFSAEKSPFLPLPENPWAGTVPFALALDTEKEKDPTSFDTQDDTEVVSQDTVQNHVKTGVPDEFKRVCEKALREVRASAKSTQGGSTRSAAPFRRFSIARHHNSAPPPPRKNARLCFQRNPLGMRNMNVFFTSFLQNTVGNATAATPASNGTLATATPTLTPTELFDWKHIFPRSWERDLRQFFRHHFVGPMTQKAFFNVYASDHVDWSYFRLAGTLAHLEKAKEVLCLFIVTSLPKEFITFYISRMGMFNLPRQLVQWARFPPSSGAKWQGRPSLYSACYTLVTFEDNQGRSQSHFRIQGTKTYTHAAFFKEASLLHQPSSNVYAKRTLAEAIHRFQIYHLYFKALYPSAAKCKCLGSLGKWVYTYPPGTAPSPYMPLPLEDVEKQSAQANARSKFHFYLWHPQDVIFSILTEAGFMLTRHWQIVTLDVPLKAPFHTTAKTKWLLRGNQYVFKSSSFKHPVPIKLTLNFTGLIYDLRIRLVYKIEKQVMENSIRPLLNTKEWQDQAQHGQPEGKLTQIEKWLFVHVKFPVQVKLSHWHPQSAGDFFTLQFQLAMPIGNVSGDNWELVICNFLDLMCAVASAFSLKPTR